MEEKGCGERKKESWSLTASCQRGERKAAKKKERSRNTSTITHCTRAGKERTSPTPSCGEKEREKVKEQKKKKERNSPHPQTNRGTGLSHSVPGEGSKRLAGKKERPVTLFSSASTG